MAALCIVGSPAATAADGWSSAPDMSDARNDHTATLLGNGNVLVAGAGLNDAAAAERYDPGTDTWSAAGRMSTTRFEHTATLLGNGKVLVAGGSRDHSSQPGASMATAELYDPASNTWSPAAKMSSARFGHSATLLPNGKVLVAGGFPDGEYQPELATAELYDPGSNTWSPAGTMSHRRFEHTATLLTNGKVLVVGGDQAQSGTADLYDPASNTWSAAGQPSGLRQQPTATLLPNGKVLVAGGYIGAYPSATAELYDPASNTWSPAANMLRARVGGRATLLPSGKVLVAGGEALPFNSSSTEPIAAAELYDPASNTWSPAADMSRARSRHTATLLGNGKVLVAGGTTLTGDYGDVRSITATAELYGPPPRVLAHWPLGESGTTATDVAGDNDGTYEGNHTPLQYGVVGGATGFNGTGGRVAVPDLGSAHDFTVEGFERINAGGTQPAYGNHTLYGAAGRVRLLPRPQGVYAGVWLGGSEYPIQVATASNVGRWVHWALVREGSTLRVYRNGVDVGSRSDLPGTDAHISGSIGRQDNAYSANADIDEVTVNDGALTREEIVRQLDSAGPLADSSVAAYWRLGEASGTVARDLARPNDGTYEGAFTLGVPGALAGDPDTAVRFNGTGGRVRVPDLGSDDSFTIEGFERITAGGTQPPSGNHTLYGSAGRVRLIPRPKGVYAGIWVGGTEYILQRNNADLNLDSWVHWALVREGSRMRLYRNGSEIASRNDLPAGTTPITGFIGRQDTNYSAHADIDEVAVYSAVLSQSRLQAHAAAAH